MLVEDNEKDDDDNGKADKSFSTSTLILLRSLTVWKGLNHNIYAARLQSGQNMTYFPVLLLNILWS